jgi:hypothetical protein
LVPRRNEDADAAKAHLLELHVNRRHHPAVVVSLVAAVAEGALALPLSLAALGAMLQSKSLITETVTA